MIVMCYVFILIKDNSQKQIKDIIGIFSNIFCECQQYYLQMSRIGPIQYAKFTKQMLTNRK
jgi:hypothetical protein